MTYWQSIGGNQARLVTQLRLKAISLAQKRWRMKDSPLIRIMWRCLTLLQMLRGNYVWYSVLQIFSTFRGIPLRYFFNFYNILQRKIYEIRLLERHYLRFFHVKCISSFQRHCWLQKENELVAFLQLQLAEAINLQDRALIAHLHETLRCVRLFNDDGCRKLFKSLREDYQNRSPYIAYLIRCRQGLLSTLAHLDR